MNYSRRPQAENLTGFIRARDLPPHFTNYICQGLNELSIVFGLFTVREIESVLKTGSYVPTQFHALAVEVPDLFSSHSDNLIMGAFDHLFNKEWSHSV